MAPECENGGTNLKIGNCEQPKNFNHSRKHDGYTTRCRGCRPNHSVQPYKFELAASCNPSEDERDLRSRSKNSPRYCS